MDETPLHVRRLLTYWRSIGVPFLPGVSEREIELFESRHRVQLPSDFRAFFLATNGTFVEGTTGADLRDFDFWRLEDLKPVEGEPTVLYFADCMQGSWQYAIAVEDGPLRAGSVAYVSPTFVVLAKSYREFIDLYLRDDPLLYSREADSGL